MSSPDLSNFVRTAQVKLNLFFYKGQSLPKTNCVNSPVIVFKIIVIKDVSYWSRVRGYPQITSHIFIKSLSFSLLVRHCDVFLLLRRLSYFF